MLNMIQSCFLFAAVGATLKFIDQAYDENLYSKTTALLVSPLCGFFAGYLGSLDPNFFVLLLAVTIGCIVSRKIDNPAFFIASVIFIFTLILRTQEIEFQMSHLIILGILSVCAYIDEVENDQADRCQRKRPREIFFRYKGLMKLTVVITWILEYLRLEHVICFFLFDSAYLFVDLWSTRRCQNLESAEH